jgi:hypothetical protein
MPNNKASIALAEVFSELIDGATKESGPVVLNSGDAGLLQSLDKLSASDASRNANDGATIAAHAQHLRFGLSLMNRWAREGGNPFANALWDDAWTISRVDSKQWDEIRAGLRDEARRWLEVLNTMRESAPVDYKAGLGSVAHLAYHLGAIRQIDTSARGPREGTFT